MAINKYDQAAQAQFINTYVPIPFEQMMQAGQMKQNRYDKASTAVDSAIGAAEEITAVPFSDDERRAKEYVANMRAIRDEYVTKDISDPFVQREMSNKLRSAVNTEDVKHIQQTYQNYVSYNKQLAENESKGIPTPDFKKQRFEGFDSRKGVFTGNAPTYKDPQKELDDFFKPLEVTEKGSFKEKINGVETGYISNLMSIDMNDINAYTKANLKTLINGPAMRDVIAEAEHNGDTRPKEEIALDYVNANSQNRVKSAPGTYRQIDKGNNAYNPFARIPRGVEVLGKEGQHANGSPMSGSEWDNKTTELQTAAKKGDINAKNKVTFLNKIDQTYHAKSIEEQDIARNRRLPDLYNKAEQIFKQKGKSVEEAKNFVNNFLGQSNIEDLVKNEKWLYRNDIDKLVDTNLEWGLSDALYKELGETNSIKKTGYGEMKELTESVKDLLKEQFSIQKTNQDLSLEKKNSILPTQETYTTLGNDYITDSSGRVLYQYSDQKGDLQSAPSALFSSLKDFMSQPDNYAKSVFRVDGKEVTKPRKIDNLLQSGKFTIDGVYSQPDGQGQPRAVLSIHDKDKNGKDIKVGEVEVRLPSGLLENGKNYYDEFVSMGKPNLAYNLAYRMPITNKINNNDWEKQPVKTVISTASGDRMEVVYDKKNSTFSINIIGKDGVVTNLQKGVEYNDLAGLATDEWYSITN